MKRSSYIIIAVAVIVLAIVAGYFFLSQKGASPTQPSAGSLPTATSGTSSSGDQESTPLLVEGGAQTKTFGVIAGNPVRSFFVDGENNAILVQPDGQIIKVTRGEAVALSSAPVVNLLISSFSFDGKKILFLFGDEKAPQLSIFDVTTKTWQPVPVNPVAVAWAPHNYQIVYLAEKNGLRVLTTLNVADPKAKPQELTGLHEQDLSLSWVGANQILLSQKANALSAGSIWSFEIKNKILAPLVQDQLGLEAAWNPSTSMGLLFVGNESGRGGQLTLIDAQGKTLTRLSFLTLASKCAFETKPVAGIPVVPTSTKTKAAPAPTQIQFKAALVCAVPRNAEELNLASLPDAYEKRALFTIDDFYRIDLETGVVSPILKDAPRGLDASALRVFGDRLFFINRFDQKLYSVPLE